MIKQCVGLLLMAFVVAVFLAACESSEGRTPEPETRKWMVEDSVVIDTCYGFVNMEADTIIDPKGNMSAFYAKLFRLSEEMKSSDGFQVNILHYGDSHIQAGDITGVVMRRMQHRFGNAGRGLLVPHRITKSNEPLDFKIETPNNFARARLTDREPETTIGVGGVGFKSEDNQQHFKVIMLERPADTMDYKFNHVRVFHDPMAPVITAPEEFLADMGDGDNDKDYVTDVNLLEKVDTMLLYTYKKDEYKDGAVYGFSVDNGESGVLYHTMGINGACFLHWGRNREVIWQSKALNPDLIVVSMGSNEASGRNFIEDVFYREIDSFIAKIRKENPRAAVLLTTPPEAMRMSKRTAVPNANFEKVRNTIIRYGNDKGVAVFDLYETTGGDGSSQKWVENDLMQRDRIHYKQEGYKIQGLLIYGALLNGYIKHNVNK